MEILLWLVGLVAVLGIGAYAFHAWKMQDPYYRHKVEQAMQDEDARKRMALLKRSSNSQVRDLADKL